MTNVKLNKLKARALRVAPYLDRLPEEQVEAIFASAIKYHPKSLMDRIRILEASVSKEEFKLILVQCNIDIGHTADRIGRGH